MDHIRTQLLQIGGIIPLARPFCEVGMQVRVRVGGIAARPALQPPEIREVLDPAPRTRAEDRLGGKFWEYYSKMLWK